MSSGGQRKARDRGIVRGRRNTGTGVLMQVTSSFCLPVLLPSCPVLLFLLHLLAFFPLWGFSFFIFFSVFFLFYIQVFMSYATMLTFFFISLSLSLDSTLFSFPLFPFPYFLSPLSFFFTLLFPPVVSPHLSLSLTFTLSYSSSPLLSLLPP